MSDEEAKITCEFRFKCPKVWHLLQPTQQEGIRHCPECDREVHLAPTEEEFRWHAAQGHCVAVPVVGSMRPGECGQSQDIRELWVGMPASRIPYNAGEPPVRE